MRFMQHAIGNKYGVLPGRRGLPGVCCLHCENTLRSDRADRARDRMKCLLTELEQSECSHCKTRGEQIRWFDAQYDGRCSHHACGLPIIAGERITEVSDGTYQHARCRRRA